MGVGAGPWSYPLSPNWTCALDVLETSRLTSLQFSARKVILGPELNESSSFQRRLI